MKKIMKASLALLLMAGLSGCMNKNEEGNDSLINQTKVCVSINREDASKETLYEIKLAAAFAEIADTFPTTLSFYNVSNDQSAQISGIDTMIKDKCSAIIVELVDPASALLISERHKLPVYH